VRSLALPERQALEEQPEGMKVVVAVGVRRRRRLRAVPGGVVVPSMDEDDDDGAV
jgi:hypothetical protein